MISARSAVVIYYYLVLLGPSLAFVVSPAAMIAVFVARRWRSLASPWGYISVSVVVLYVMAAVFVCLAFLLAVSFTGIGVGVTPPPPPLFERYGIPVAVYASLAAFLAFSIAFLGYLSSIWSK
jgi:hypothetical protein